MFTKSAIARFAVDMHPYGCVIEDELHIRDGAIKNFECMFAIALDENHPAVYSIVGCSVPTLDEAYELYTLFSRCGERLMKLYNTVVFGTANDFKSAARSATPISKTEFFRRINAMRDWFESHGYDCFCGEETIRSMAKNRPENALANIVRTFVFQDGQPQKCRSCKNCTFRNDGVMCCGVKQFRYNVQSETPRDLEYEDVQIATATPGYVFSHVIPTKAACKSNLAEDYGKRVDDLLYEYRCNNYAHR